MPSLLESVTALLGQGDAYTKLGNAIGGDADQATAAAGAATPALIAGLASKAAGDDGPAAVSELLDGVDDSAVEASASFDAGDVEVGTGLLDGIFGDDRGGLTSGFAGNADLDGLMITKALPLLAPLVVGTVARRRAEEDLDADGVARMLATEAEALDGDGLLDSLGDFFGRGFGTAAGVSGVAAAVAGDAKDSLSAKFGGAKQAALSSASAPVDDDRNGGLGWLWWALGAVVLVLLLAWVLSTCNEEEIVDAGGAADQSDDADEDPAGEDAMNEDAGEDAMSEDADENTGDDDVMSDADIQASVDGALAGSGVIGVVAGGVVTLSGTVPDEDARDDAVAAARAVDGVSTVTDRIEFPTQEEESDEEPAADEDPGEEDPEDDPPNAGDTINEVLDLEPVTFRVSSARLTDAGTAVLDEAAAFLDANSDVRVEIGGHTDSDGADAENLNLSQRRADSVKEYLVASGIDGDRMETKGYGEAEPKVPNDSLAAKAENRRIEFTIL